MFSNRNYKLFDIDSGIHSIKKGSLGTGNTNFVPTIGIQDEFVFYQTITLTKLHVTISNPPELPFGIPGNMSTNAEMLHIVSESPPDILPSTTTAASCSTSLLIDEPAQLSDAKSESVVNESEGPPDILPSTTTAVNCSTSLLIDEPAQPSDKESSFLSFLCSLNAINLSKPNAEQSCHDITRVEVTKKPTETFGFQLTSIDGSIVFYDVGFGTPAYNAGLRNGDELLCVNEESICKLTEHEVKSIIQDDTYIVFRIKKTDVSERPPAHHSTTSIPKSRYYYILELCSEIGTPRHQKYPLTDLCLHPTVGTNIQRLLLNGRMCLGYRHQHPFRQGYAFSANPLKSGQAIVFQIISTTMCTGSFIIGFTACDPATMTQSDLPNDVSTLLDRSGYWMARIYMGTNFERGDELTMLIMKNGEVTLSRNGSETYTVMHIDNTLKLWALFAIRGSTECVRFYSMMIPESELLPQSNENSSKSSSKNKGSESRESVCAICLEKPINSVLYTCGHMSMCYECAIEVRSRGDGRCPLCRAYIADVIRTYKA